MDEAWNWICTNNDLAGRAAAAASWTRGGATRDRATVASNAALNVHRALKFIGHETSVLLEVKHLCLDDRRR